MDLIPDLDGSTFWSQTLRVKDMGDFAADGEYLLPDSVRGNTTVMPGQSKLFERPKTVEDFYHEQMNWSASAYKKMVKAGVPIEDARNILPLGCQHRMSWKVNLSALMHVLSKRSCTISQLGMWRPIIFGVVDELATKVHPYFRRLVDPPCFDRGAWKGCCFKLENANRVKGEDPYPPCSLYLGKHGLEAAATASEIVGGPWHPLPDMSGVESVKPEMKEELTRKSIEYKGLWGRNPWTGDPLPPDGLGEEQMHASG